MLSEKDILSKGSYTSLNDVKNFNGWGGNYTDVCFVDFSFVLVVNFKEFKIS